MRYITKIASVTGQKWRGVFQKLARRLATGESRRARENDSGRVTVRTNIYDGYIGKSTRRRDTVTTYVIDPPGRYIQAMAIAVVTPFPGGGGLLGSAVSEISTELPRDVFNPYLSLEALDPVPPVSFNRTVGIKAWGTELGSLSGPAYNFYMSSPGEGGGVAASQVLRLQNSPPLDEQLTVVDERSTLFLIVNYASGVSTISVTSRHPSQPWHVLAMPESYIGGLSSGFKMTSRYIAAAKITRQLPYIASARDHGRMASCGVMTTNPKQAFDSEFPHRGGEIGLYFHLAFVKSGKDGSDPAVYDFYAKTLSSMDLGVIEAERWDDSLPWIQEYTVPGSDPPEKAKISYPPVGQYLADEDNRQVISDMMSSAFGVPTVCIKEESVEFLVDLRVARAWVDRRGLDYTPELTPITVQTQTGLVLVTLNGFTSEGLPAGPSVQLIANDASGAVKNGCFRAYGGSDEKAHRIWRTVWSGNAGGKHVALVSVVKHDRLEDAKPGVDFLKTAQSSFSGTPVPTDDPVAIQLYVDGVLTERSATSLGYSLRSNGEALLAQADYDWVYRANKCATVAGENIVFFSAFSYPVPDQVLIIRWDVGSNALSVIRRLPARVQGGLLATSALSCYHQQELGEDGKETSPACILLRHGNHFGPGWVELTKDYGVSWTRVGGSDVAVTNTPELGVFYAGSQLSAVNYGEIFKAEFRK